MLIEWIDNFKKAAFDPVHEPGHIKCRNIGTPGSRDDDLRVQRFKVQRFNVQRFKGSKVPPEAVQVSAISSILNIEYRTRNFE